MRFQTFLHNGHGGEVTLGHRAVMDTGVGESGVDMFVTQQCLNGGDFAASIDQLRGEGVAQLVGCHRDPGAFASRLDTATQEILVHRPMTIKENVVGWGIAANG